MDQPYEPPKSSVSLEKKVPDRKHRSPGPFPRVPKEVKKWGIHPSIVYALLLLYTFGPIICVTIAVSMAAIGNCDADEGSIHPCIILGVDFGGLVYTLGVAGWLALLTIPTGMVVILVYTILLLIYWLTK